jgi:hypothetical protein
MTDGADRRADASEATKAANAAMAAGLDFGDRRDFEEAARGLVAPLPDGGKVLGADGGPVWDLSRFAFIHQGADAPDTVNPSLWRQMQLTVQGGLYEVVPGLYQVRTLDLSNITIAEGDDGLVGLRPADLDRDGRRGAGALLRAPAAQAGGGPRVLAQPRRPLRRRARDRRRGRCARGQGQGHRAGRLPGGRGGRERARGQRHEPALELHVRQPAAGRSEGAGRCGARGGHLVGHDQPAPADRARNGDRAADDHRRAGLRVHARAGQRGAGGDALVHRAVRRRDRCGELLPHAAQHLLDPRHEDPRSARLVEVPPADDRPLGRPRRGHVRHAPLARVGPGARARNAGHGPRRLPLHQRRDAASGQPRPDAERDRRAGRIPARAVAPLGDARLLRDAQPQRQGHLRQLPGLVRRQPGNAAHPPAGGGGEALRRVHGRRRRGAREGARRVRAGRLPLGGRGRQPRRLRRSRQPGRARPAGRRARAARLPGRVRPVAQLLPHGRAGAAPRRPAAADPEHREAPTPSAR